MGQVETNNIINYPMIFNAFQPTWSSKPNLGDSLISAWMKDLVFISIADMMRITF